MPTPNPLTAGDILQVQVHLNPVGQEAINVLHYITGSVTVGTNYGESLDFLGQTIFVDDIESILTPYRSIVPDNVSFTYGLIQRVYPTRDYYLKFNLGVEGTWNTGGCQTPNLSAVINKQSARAGRGRHGSFHAAGLPVDAYEVGRLTEAFKTAAAPLVTWLKSPVESVPGGGHVLTPGMFHPGLGAGANWSEIVGTSLMDTVRVMRRRTVGVGI